MMKKQMQSMKKYIKKRAVRTTVIFLILSLILSVASIVWFASVNNTAVNTNIKSVSLYLAIFFPTIAFVCAIVLMGALFSVIRMDGERIFLPGKGMIKFDNVRSFSIRFIEEDKREIAGTVFFQFFLIIISLFVGEDCTAPTPDVRSHFECIFHMKEGDDIKFLFQGYNIEQSREIIENLQSKIFRYYVL